MKLKLFWKDLNGKSYILGYLYKENDNFCFDIVDKEELKKATRAGCFGIGELNLFYSHHTSDTLFEFFKRRIPPRDHVMINEILEELCLEEYDEMELLRATQGILNTDRYYLEE